MTTAMERSWGWMMMAARRCCLICNSIACEIKLEGEMNRVGSKLNGDCFLLVKYGFSIYCF